MTDNNSENKESVEEGQRIEERYLQEDRENALKTTRDLFHLMEKLIEANNTEVIDRYRTQVEDHKTHWITQQYYMALGKVEAYSIIYTKLKEGIFQDCNQELFDKFLKGERHRKVTMITCSSTNK